MSRGVDVSYTTLLYVRVPRCFALLIRAMRSGGRCPRPCRALSVPVCAVCRGELRGGGGGGRGTLLVVRGTVLADTYAKKKCVTRAALEWERAAHSRRRSGSSYVLVRSRMLFFGGHEEEVNGIILLIRMHATCTKNET